MKYVEFLAILLLIIISFRQTALQSSVVIANEAKTALIPTHLRDRVIDRLNIRNHEKTFSVPKEIVADAVLFGDLTNGQIISGKNTQTRLPIASISKIMTAYVVLHELPTTSEIPISLSAIRTEGPAGNLTVGEVFSLKDLITIMMVESSNDAAAALAEYVGAVRGGESYSDRQQIFIDLLNDYALELDMYSTIFQTPSGLDLASKQPSNLSSTEDLFKLIIASREYPEIWNGSRHGSISVKSLSGNLHQLKNTNDLAKNLTHLIGSKTGTTITAGESNVLLFEQPFGAPKVLILLGMPFGTRTETIKTFIELTEQNL